ncbi:hypothetical protein [Synechococcus phage Yong-L2-223]|nr:hypothetical protein [Synechococcus phage Yong-L2-223]
MHPETRKRLYTKLENWHKLAIEVAKLRDQENELRREIVDEFFAGAEEGTNTITLDYGKVLKANVTINRKVDAEQLEALKTTAKDTGKTSVLMAIDTLFTYKPSLSVSGWRGMTAEEQKVFADVITEQPGSPSLSIDTPKR